jgi:hypothetical protein
VIADRVRAISAKDEARAISVLTAAVQEARVKFERDKRERDALLAKRRGIESAMDQDSDVEFGLDAQGRRTIAWYKRKAEHGSAMAQFQLGKYYELGQETPVDMNEAVRWYDMAAQQGYPDAQYYLGMLTLYGIGVEKNDVLGQSLIKAAAGQGHEQARRALSRISATPALQHLSIAAWWLVRYGQDQNGLALQHAGSLFDQGRGVPVDRAEAQRLIQKGAALGTKRAELSEIAPEESGSPGPEVANAPPTAKSTGPAASVTREPADTGESEVVAGTPMTTRLALFAAIAAIPLAVFYRMYSREKKRLTRKKVSAGGPRPAQRPTAKQAAPAAPPTRKRDGPNPFK